MIKNRSLEASITKTNDIERSLEASINSYHRYAVKAGLRGQWGQLIPSLVLLRVISH